MQGQIDWHILGGLRRIDHPYIEARQICSIEQTLLACYMCPQHGDKNYVSIEPMDDETEEGPMFEEPIERRIWEEPMEENGQGG